MFACKIFNQTMRLCGVVDKGWRDVFITLTNGLNGQKKPGAALLFSLSPELCSKGFLMY